MTILLAFVLGAALAAAAILIARRGTQPAELPTLAELRQTVQALRVDQRGEAQNLRGLVEGFVEQRRCGSRPACRAGARKDTRAGEQGVLEPLGALA